MSVEILVTDVCSLLKKERQLDIRLVVGFGFWGQPVEDEVVLDRKRRNPHFESFGTNNGKNDSWSYTNVLRG